MVQNPAEDDQTPAKKSKLREALEQGATTETPKNLNPTGAQAGAPIRFSHIGAISTNAKRRNEKAAEESEEGTGKQRKTYERAHEKDKEGSDENKGDQGEECTELPRKDKRKKRCPSHETSRSASKKAKPRQEGSSSELSEDEKLKPRRWSLKQAT